MTDRPVHVEIAQPFAHAPGEPTLSFTVPTTPGFSTGATISQQAARDLIRELQAGLDRINQVIRLAAHTYTNADVDRYATLIAAAMRLDVGRLEYEAASAVLDALAQDGRLLPAVKEG